MFIMKLKFSERLKELRTARNMSQQAMAEFLNVKQPTIARWEKGLIEVDLLTLMKLAKYFGVTTDYLLGLSDF